MNKFNATKEQVLQIAANAINASIPVGMGYLHFKSKNYTPEELQMEYEAEDKRGNIYLDYFDGRMVKLSIQHLGDNSYATNEGEANIEYQSWARKYPTYEDLTNSVLGEPK